MTFICIFILCLSVVFVCFVCLLYLCVFRFRLMFYASLRCDCAGALIALTPSLVSYVLLGGHLSFIGRSLSCLVGRGLSRTGTPQSLLLYAGLLCVTAMGILFRLYV